MKTGKILLYLSPILLITCNDHKSEGLDARKLVAEIRRIGVDSFRGQINHNLSIPPSYYVEFDKVDGLSAGLKEELLECFFIEEKAKPRGITFVNNRGKTYYVSLDELNVPDYYSSYKKRKIDGSVYAIWR